MLASPRIWWRIAAQIEDQMLRPAIPTRRGNKWEPWEKPVVQATGPGQAWSCYAEVEVMPIPPSAARVPAVAGAGLSA